MMHLPLMDVGVAQVNNKDNTTEMKQAIASQRQSDKQQFPSVHEVSGGLLQRACACGNHTHGAGHCASCKKKRMNLQRSPAGRMVDIAGQLALPIVHDVLSQQGSPLDAEARAYMEPLFNRDFSQVRVHADARGAASARSIDALAYTVGSHVVFDQGQYAPETSAGQKLLAHELTHVVQQAAGHGYIARQGLEVSPEDASEREAQSVAERVSQGNSAGSLLPAADTKIHRQRRPAARTITLVDVDQKTPQQVTIHWSDGSPEETDMCSTGKGHCCLDGSQAIGGACSESGSQVSESNCTPVGTFTVMFKLPHSRSGVPFWTQFHPRQIALHEYSPVDGTPLSHGCVRLHQATAEKIYNGAVPGRTRVRVRNLAQPKCDHPALQREWLEDFQLAGSTPPDGERIDPATGQRRTPEELRDRRRRRRSISIERSALRSALGTDNAGLDAVIAEIGQQSNGFLDDDRALQAAQLVIPRCVPAQTVEEARLPEARQARVAPSARPVRAFRRTLERSSGLRAAQIVVQRTGQALWNQATARAQVATPNTDDRQLYWERLQLTEVIRQFNARWLRSLNPDQDRRAREQLLNAFERASRGMQSAGFEGARQGEKRVLISGFDPFGLDSSFGGDIRQGNPSGAAVLALDGRRLSARGVSALVQGVIFPVRYPDFNESILESLMRPHLGTQPVNLVMTISMGSSQDFELEEFAGRRRSSEYPDNLGLRSGGSASQPVVPPGLAPGPEFIRTNVSAATLGSMRGALGRRQALPGETQVRQSSSASGSPIAMEGSGGGYLSNEIFYRTSLLRTQTGSTVPVIHLHTPHQDPNANQAQRTRVIETIRRLIEAALPTI
jgi:pyrrolidone-carboxylate peptidase